MLHTRGRIHNTIAVYRFWNREYLKPIGRKNVPKISEKRRNAKTVTTRDWSKFYMTECDWLLKGSHMTNGSLASE